MCLRVNLNINEINELDLMEEKVSRLSLYRSLLSHSSARMHNEFAHHTMM